MCSRTLAVVGTFPFSDFHETTEQTKMAAMIQHLGRRPVRLSRMIHLQSETVGKFETLRLHSDEKVMSVSKFVFLFVEKHRLNVNDF